MDTVQASANGDIKAVSATVAAHPAITALKALDMRIASATASPNGSATGWVGLCVFACHRTWDAAGVHAVQRSHGTRTECEATLLSLNHHSHTHAILHREVCKTPCSSDLECVSAGW